MIFDEGVVNSQEYQLSHSTKTSETMKSPFGFRCAAEGSGNGKEAWLFRPGHQIRPSPNIEYLFFYRALVKMVSNNMT